MKKQRIFVLLTVICLLAMLIPMAVSAQLADGWHDGGNGRWCYLRDGQWVMSEVIQVGGVYYGFDDEGYMYAGEEFWCDGWYYRAKADGTLYVNSWYQDKENDYWFYYGAEGKPANDFKKMGNTWYFFGYDGRMAQDELVWSNDYGRYYAISKDGTASKALSLGWNSAYGSWYYLYEHVDYGIQSACGESMEIGGLRYYFHYDGKMAAGELIYDDYLEAQVFATADGPILKNGWASYNGDWYYAEEYQLYEYGIYEIGNALYYFQGHKMYDIPGEYENYYVGNGGALYRNQWRYDGTGYPGEVGYVYYGEDGRKVYSEVRTINGTAYYFNYDGIMQTNALYVTDEAVYLFDKDGKGTEVNGWFQHPESKEWMYARDGELAEGLLTLSGTTYAFNNGYMVSEWFYTQRNPETDMLERYLFDKDGKLITTPGWKRMGGYWYYIVNNTGLLKNGWMQLGGKWYYMDPEAISNTVFQDPESVEYYAADNNGVATLLTGTGWRQLSWGRVYLENGKPVVEAWRQLGGSWYYFNEYGDCVLNQAYEINGVYYVFNVDGKMVTNSWQYDYNGWCYADANGVAATGLKTIGGKQYLFSEYGYSYRDGVYYLDDAAYWLDGNGVVIAQVKEGWNSVNGKWYYVQDGEILHNCLLWQGDVCYGFDSDGAMCTNGIKYAWYDYYMFNAEGHVLTGWQKFDGKWYYADPESSDPYIYWSGIYDIGGNEYVFADGYMQIGTFYMWGQYITTDSSGVVISHSELKDGWNYVGDRYVYLKNGQWHTGWVGDYYVQDGEMLFAQKVEYGGKYYWLGADGRMAKNGWISYNYDYMYAKADGTLYCSEWLKLGSRYYYFYNTYMIADGVYEIDGKYHEFNADGVWLGEVTWESENYPTMSDGWHKIGNKWYYYHANNRQFGTRYIGGSWYGFDYEDGAMVTNAIFNDFYYGSDGKRAAYTGWKKVSGEWVYFNADYSVHYGWIKSGNGWYLTNWYYNEDTYQEYAVMVSNEAVRVGEQLYYFDANGYSSGPLNKNGWYQAGGQWYYLINGAPVYGRAYKIGGAEYYFNYDGIMVTNDAIRSDETEGFRYYGADGKAVTTEGWKQIYGEWIYIGANGFLYEYGIYRIGGVDYAFRECIWVQ